MPKKLVKDVGTLTVASVGLGAGAVAISKVGSPVAVGGAVSGLAGGMGSLGTVVAAKHILRKSQEGLQMPRKRRKKRR